MTVAEVSDNIGVVSLPPESNSVPKIPNTSVTTEQDLEKQRHVWQTKLGVLVSLIETFGTDELRMKAVKAIGFEDWSDAEQALRTALEKTDLIPLIAWRPREQMFLLSGNGLAYRKVVVEETRMYARVRDISSGDGIGSVSDVHVNNLLHGWQLPEGAKVEE